MQGRRSATTRESVNRRALGSERASALRATIVGMTVRASAQARELSLR